MHCSRPAREFLHFLLFFGRLADTRQAIELKLLLDFLHFRHFLQPLLLDCIPWHRRSIDCAPSRSGWTQPDEMTLQGGERSRLRPDERRIERQTPTP